MTRKKNRERYGFISVRPETRRALIAASDANNVSAVKATTALVESWLDEAERKDVRELDFADEFWR